MTQEALRTPFTRIFITENDAGPGNVPVYQGLGRAGGIDWGQGTIEPLRAPSRDRYDSFDIIDVIRGAADLPQITIENRMGSLYSDLLRMVRKGCKIGLQIHAGSCQNPEDFDGGWDTALIIEGALPTNYSTDDLGALGPDQNQVITETVPLAGEDMYPVKKLRPSEVAAAAITDVINRVIICDSKSCGECGIESDGCQVAFAVAGPQTGSPGLGSELLYTRDGGATWSSTNITTMAVSEEALDGVCVGTRFVVISVSGGTGRLHWAPIADILNGDETWTLVTAGVVAAGDPIRMFALDSTHLWIAASAGYIYFSDDVTVGVEVQTDGSATAQDLNAIHAVDSKNAVAVGNSNAVLSTNNGGTTWSLITGPAVGVNLLSVYMKSQNTWLVGTADGKLYFTDDSGATWTEKTFSGSGSGNIRSIDFSTKSVGYMAVDNGATPVRAFVYRTINGGNSWVQMPEEQITAPSALSFRSVAACKDDPNVVFAGGTATGGTDGLLIKYA